MGRLQRAGIGLFALTLAVTPAHVYMLQRPDLFGVPVWVLWLRLPPQVGLLWLIAWSTFGPERRPALQGSEPRQLQR